MTVLRIPTWSNEQNSGDLRARYDRAAGRWHRGITKRGYPQAYSELLATALGTANTKRPFRPNQVLDVGTGSGAMSLALASLTEHEFELDLLDVSARMLETASANLSDIGQRSRTILGGVDHLRKSDRQYDLILCAHVIEHCPDIVEALTVIRKALSPNGLVVLAVSKPHWCTALLQFFWRHRAYRPEEFMSFLASAGFRSTTPHAFTAGPPSYTSFGYTAR